MSYKAALVVEVETSPEEICGDAISIDGADISLFEKSRAIIYGNNKSSLLDIAGRVLSAEKIYTEISDDNLLRLEDVDPMKADLIRQIGRPFIYIVAELWDPPGGILEQFINQMGVNIFCYCDGKILERDADNPILVKKSELTAVHLSPMPSASGEDARIWAIEPIIEKEKTPDNSL